ncbi:LCP family protein [uncultured Traorella sp.]|uniref:LCP family protein n=1 Tax=uncultured Traorella sp. TaxID=1929048 RepID=UPI0025CD40EB|nr:LCP family protein [uncultured Traorella sp.]
MKDRTKKINKRIDLVLLILFLAGSLYFLIEAIAGEMIPMNYILIAGVVLLLIFLLIFATFRIENMAVFVIRKILLAGLCVLLVFGAVFQGRIRSAFANVDDGSTNISRMYVIALEDSSLQSMDDVETLGYVDHANALITYSIEQLQSYSMEEMAYNSVDEMLAALNADEIEAAMISDQDQSFEIQKENSTYSDDYKIIHTIEMKTTSESDTVDNDLSKPFVVYVSGMDDMGEPTYNGLSDVNMLLMVDPQNHHVEMISINRDTYVPNAKYNDYPDKLTHLGWDGVEAGAAALERIFGIEIDYTAKVTFESLIEIVDTLGGIDVDVQLDFCEQDENRSFASADLICLNKGYQHLNGSQALAYARHRHTAGWDVKGREQAQRDIISAIVNKLLSVEGALKAGDVLNVASNYVSTNLPMSSVKSFVMNAISDGHAWTFGSSTVNSNYEYLFPCASYTSQDLYAVLLEEEDIMHVHDLYVTMKSDESFSDFAFDLNDMERYENTFELDPKVITVENYYDTVPAYFPSYLRHNF